MDSMLCLRCRAKDEAFRWRERSVSMDELEVLDTLYTLSFSEDILVEE